MRLTFLGHQGWLVEADGSAILVDPILTRSFGSSERVRFSIFPLREIDVDGMPAVDAVVLTTDHIQHFHLESLALLERHIPIYVGVLFAESAVVALRVLGFDVVRVASFRAIEVGALRARLLPAGAETPVWDKRTNSLVIEDAHTDDTVLVQSDVATADVFTAMKRVNRRVSAVICTNNSQISVWPRRGAWANQLPLRSERNHGPVGLRILRSVLLDVADAFEHFPLLILNGNGHVALDQLHGPFLWGQKELEEHARTLSLGQRVWGPEPGETITIGDATTSERVPWIRIHTQAMEAFAERVIATRPRDIDPIFEPTENDAAIVERGLRALTAPLLMSPLGRRIAARDEYRGQPITEERFALRLRAPGGDRVLVLNLARGTWSEKAIDARATLLNYPFGIDVHLADLAALFEGRIQAWELCSTSLRQWFIGTQLDCPTAFFYTYFDEGNRQDLSAKNYEQQLDCA